MTEETQNPNVNLNAKLTCPMCETVQKVVMPENQFQHYYKCTNDECLADLAPTEGKDCIFCSYADKVCPQRQVDPEINKKHLQSLI